MERVDVDVIRLRARRHYEWGRWRRALWGALPAVVLVALSARSAPDVGDPIAGGALLAVVSVVFLWRGRDAGRAVVPGTMAGVVPFAAALALRWTGETRFALCAAAAFVASGLGGLTLARSRTVGRRWLYSSAIALLTGSIACTCVGLGGMLGLVLGLAAVAGPSMVLASRTSVRD